MSILDYFIGTTQSKYASVAMFLSILMICIAILVTNTEVPIGMRIGVVFFVILISIFPIALSLFELTCIVTGGRNNRFNLCNYFAWFITIMIIIYSFILIIMVISSMFTYKKAKDKIVVSETMQKISTGDANTIAQNMLNEGFNQPNAPPSDAPNAQPPAAPPAQPVTPPAQPVTPPAQAVQHRPQNTQSASPSSMSQFDNYMPF